MKKIWTMIFPLIALCSCGNGAQSGEVVPGIDPTDLDTTVSPKTNFYAYATGGWQKKNPLKPEYARYGSFDILGENNEKRLNELFQSMTETSAPQGSSDQKIADLYKMGLDSLRNNAAGAEPLKGDLNAILAIQDKAALIDEVAALHLCGDDVLFAGGVSSDMIDSNTNVFYLNQSGLGMSDRDYYVKGCDTALKEGYKAFLAKVLTLAGLDNVEQRAANALKIEDQIAEASWTSVECRDIQKQYNPTTFGELNSTYPYLAFSRYFLGLKVNPNCKIIVSQPSYFRALNNIVANNDLEVLKDYLLAQTVSGACGALSDEFSEASFDFFSRQMAGVQQQKPRWKRAMAVPNALLSEAVGKMYVEKYFPAKDKEKMAQMVRNIQTALSEHIDSLDWMSPETKAKAQEKLAAFTVKIGYPDKWKDYSSLEIDPALSYYANIKNASQWYVRDNLDRLGKPVDKDEWLMSPQTVNAYYNPTTNEICFPAAILQPPFFNPNADDAVNYGAIGVVISHEMTHGFDDQGRLFDKDGNLADWWTEADAKAFKAKTEKLVEQFNAVEVLPGVKANGALCLGENIADQGGLRVAYTAMQNSFGGKYPADIDGFTADQRFYLAYAKLWADNITDEEIARRTKLDVHSLGRNRVNVTLRNLDTFFKAFDIKEGDAMYREPADRVVIW